MTTAELARWVVYHRRQERRATRAREQQEDFETARAAGRRGGLRQR